MKVQLSINNKDTAQAIVSLLFRQTVKEILYNIVIYENYQARCRFEQFLKSKDKITIPDILEYKGNPIGTIKVLDIVELRKDEEFVFMYVLFGCTHIGFINRMLTEAAIALNLSEEDLKEISNELDGNIVSEFRTYIKTHYDIIIQQEPTKDGNTEDMFYCKVLVKKDFEGFISIAEEKDILEKEMEKVREIEIKILEGSEKERISTFIQEIELQEIEKKITETRPKILEQS